MGEFDEYDIYDMVAKSKGKGNKLFNLFCKTERDRKLNSCGGGLDALLEPDRWIDGNGNSRIASKKGHDDDDDDDDEEEDEDDDDDYDTDDEL